MTSSFSIYSLRSIQVWRTNARMSLFSCCKPDNADVEEKARSYIIDYTIYAYILYLKSKLYSQYRKFLFLRKEINILHQPTGSLIMKYDILEIMYKMRHGTLQSLDYDKYPNVPYMEKMHSLTAHVSWSYNAVLK